MPDKDQLLKEQQEEINKLKKDLNNAVKPSAMLDVLKNTFKRNVHDFFVREDKMKTMDSKIKDLESELAKKEEELNRTSAELFAANLSNTPDSSDEEKNIFDTFDDDDTVSGGFPDFSDEDDDFMRTFPQDKEEAVRRYFGKIDISSLLEPDISQTIDESTIKAAEDAEIPKTTTDLQEKSEQSDQAKPSATTETVKEPLPEPPASSDIPTESTKSSTELPAEPSQTPRQPRESKRQQKNKKKFERKVTLATKLEELSGNNDETVDVENTSDIPAPEPISEPVAEQPPELNDLPDISFGEHNELPDLNDIAEPLVPTDDEIFGESKFKLAKRPERKRKNKKESQKEKPKEEQNDLPDLPELNMEPPEDFLQEPAVMSEEPELPSIEPVIEPPIKSEDTSIVTNDVVNDIQAEESAETRPVKKRNRRRRKKKKNLQNIENTEESLDSANLDSPTSDFSHATDENIETNALDLQDITSQDIPQTDDDIPMQGNKKIKIQEPATELSSRLSAESHAELSEESKIASEEAKLDDAASVCSLAPDVDGVSDSSYTSDYLATDGQQKIYRGFPSIDETSDIQPKSEQIKEADTENITQENIITENKVQDLPEGYIPELQDSIDFGDMDETDEEVFPEFDYVVEPEIPDISELPPIHSVFDEDWDD